MSLQVWLPLNGSLVNQGLSNLKFNSVNTVNFSVGKISSQSYNNNDEHAGGIISDKTLHIGNNLSMFCWVNLTQFNTDASLTGIGGMHTISRSDYEVRTGMGITVHSSGKVSFNTGTGTGTGNMPEKYSYNTYQSDVALSLNTWHHIGFTCQQTANISHVTIYIDGTKHGEFNNILNQNNPDDYVHIASWSRNGNIATPTIFPNYQPKGKINDFRIYDHCLSPREVKLLAQGLVAHYKLNQPRINNLMTDKAFYIYNNYSSSGTTGTVVATGETYLNCPVYRMTLTPNATSLSSFKTELWSHGVCHSAPTFSANTKYCYWVYYKPITHSDVRVGGVASNKGGWTELPPESVGNGWYRVGQYRDGTVTQAQTDSIYTSFYSPSAAAGVPISIDFCAPHLLAGPTHWVECQYTISSSGGVEYDCSGYGNHATISGTVGCALRDSPRYQNSYIFNGNAANRITNTTTQFYYTDNFTWSCWVKHKYPNSVSFAFTVGRADYSPDWGYGLEEVSASSMRIRFGSSSYIVSLDENNWHHLVFTKSGNNITIYVDGVPTNYTFTGTLPAYTNSQGLGIGCFWYSGGALYPFYGRLSDFRIYATAFSAAAVKELYESSMSFLDNGTLQCSEIIELGTNLKLKETGIVQIDTINEHTLKLKDGSLWKKVFYHKCNGGKTLFTSYEEILHTTSEYKYSRLSDLPSLKGSQNKYEFLLMYEALPGRSSLAGQYNRWKQTNAPQNEWKGDSDGSLTVTGYEPIAGEISWTSNYWGGLGRQNASTTAIAPCFIDGSIGHGNWFYAIGACSTHDGGIPGPNSGVEAVELWMRVENPATNLKLYNTQIETYQIYEL